MAKTTKQAAQILGVSVRRVQFLINKGFLSAQKLGRDWIIEDKDLEEFAAKDRQPGRPPKNHKK
jgi:excisionase family DNA binding protein